MKINILVRCSFGPKITFGVLVQSCGRSTVHSTCVPFNVVSSQWYISRNRDIFVNEYIASLYHIYVQLHLLREKQIAMVVVDVMIGFAFVMLILYSFRPVLRVLKKPLNMRVCS